MDILSALLLITSATLASFRNVLLKGFAPFSFKNREFFGLQATVFGIGSIALFIVCALDYNGISLFTVIAALIYGTMLLCAQWCYTIALTRGKTAICATIYSFGFLIPTLSGAIFWDETITIFGALGILTVIPVVLISGLGKKSDKEAAPPSSYIPVLLLALVCSGGLGIVQKIQQGSVYKPQTSSFILIAFFFCFLVSLTLFFAKKKGENKLRGKNIASATTVGIAFATCNLINTHLAGKLNSAVFFPVLNIGGILLSMLLGLLIYKEKLTRRDIIVLALAACAIILVNL